MRDTIMVFLGVAPLGAGAFGNYQVPLQIGAPDSAFPKLNMMSNWVYVAGGIIMLSSFFLPEGPAQSGWTSYPQLANIAPTGQTLWLFGMVANITSSLLGSVNFIVTILHLRTKGMTFMRFPFFVWAQLVTAFLVLLAFPPLEAAGRPARHWRHLSFTDRFRPRRRWTEVDVPRHVVSLSELEHWLPEVVAAHGIDASKHFPFRLDTSNSKIAYHILANDAPGYITIKPHRELLRFFNLDESQVS